MAYPLNLDAAAHAAYERALRSHHSMRVAVTLLDTEERVVTTLKQRILEGQVNVDADAEVTRSLSLTLDDADRALSFDSNSPADGALYADRLLRVTYGVKSPQMVEWVDVPVFTGPVTRLGRTGREVRVEAQGKERLALGAAWRVQHFKKGTPKVEVIEDVLRATGERHLSLSTKKEKLPSGRTVKHDTVPWKFCRWLAGGMETQLYVDGFGRVRQRDYSDRTTWTFVDGDGGTILTTPSISYDMETMRNAVEVKGKKRAGKGKGQVRAVAVAWPGHPLSPERLGRHGRGRFEAEFIEDGDIGHQGWAKKVAKRELGELLEQSVEVTFDSVVVPHLDPLDRVGVETADFTMTTRVRSFTIPLTAEGVMSVGYHRLTRRPNLGAIRG